MAVALLDLFFLNYWVIKGQKELGEGEDSPNKTEESREISAPSPSPISLASPVVAAEPPAGASETKTVVEKVTSTVVQTAQKEIFIPIGSGFNNKNSYTDIPGLEVTIDTTKYSAIESVVFEASIWVEGGNGRAWARLKNISDSNPYVEGQISSSSSSGEVKTSGNIPIPNGSKKYGIQAKTDIENFSAHVENARIKITLK